MSGIAGAIQRKLDALDAARMDRQMSISGREMDDAAPQRSLPRATRSSRLRIGRDGALDFPPSYVDDVLQRTTFGITTFDRPAHLRRLVESIHTFYPSARILIADNGRQAAATDLGRVLSLPFNCGLSAMRNAMAAEAGTEYLLLLEDDFLFVESTRVELLGDVLDRDVEVGFVSGAMALADGTRMVGTDLDCFRGVAVGRVPDRPVRVTPSGTPYRLCDLVWNFGLVRREMLADHRWDESLKLGEHLPYFWGVWRGGKWRVATCPAVAVYHDKGGRSRGYRRFRRRARGYFERWLEAQPDIEGVAVDWEPPVDHEGLPSVVVLGVGHSGTSILAKMLFALGWRQNDADAAYGESESVRSVNLVARRHKRQFSHIAARRALAELQPPWLLKDPRFIWTLHNWLPHFAAMKRPPALVWITREASDVAASYRRRGDVDCTADAVNLLSQRAADQYALWPWAKLRVTYESLQAAVRLFTLPREVDAMAEKVCGVGGNSLTG